MISLKDTDGPGTAVLDEDEDVTEQSKVIFEMYTADAIAVCVNELGLKMPLYVIHIDMGAHIVAANVYEDGRIVPLIDPGRGVTGPLYPVHTLVVDRDGSSATLVLDQKDKRMRTLH